MFVYGDERVPALMVIPAGQANAGTYRILTDHLGSVRRVVNVATGHVLQAIDYDAFGNILSDTNPGLQPFGFAGGLYDPDTGLLRFGARDYDPEIGQWTARDPIFFDGGTGNLYTYANSDPVNLIDFTGNAAQALALGPAAAISLSSILLPVVAIAAVAVIGYYIYHEFVMENDSIVENRNKGERGRTRNNGADNPWKHTRPHPSDPTRIRVRDQNGKWRDRPKPPGWDDWHNAGRPSNWNGGANSLIWGAASPANCHRLYW